MWRALALVAKNKMAVMMGALLLVGGTGVMLTSCSSGGAVRGTIASVDLAATSFILTPEQSAAGLTSITVTANPQTEFRGKLHGFSDLTTGMQVSVTGTPQTSTGTLLANEIEDQQESEAHSPNNQQAGESPGDNREAVEFTGTIVGVDSAHKAFGLKLADGSTKTVTVSSETEFEGTLHGFADLAKGQQVSVKGTLQPDGSITAAHVEAEQGDGEEQGDANEQELSGAVSSIDSAHASFGLKRADGTVTAIATNAQTEFDGGFHVFADLQIGLRVEVHGTTQSGGALLAMRVHREDEGDTSSSGNTSGGSDDSGGHDGRGGHDATSTPTAGSNSDGVPGHD